MRHAGLDALYLSLFQAIVRKDATSAGLDRRQEPTSASHPLLDDLAEARFDLLLDRKVASLQVGERIGCVPVPLLAVADGEDNVGEHRRYLWCQLLAESGDGDLRTSHDFICLTLNVGEEYKMALGGITGVPYKVFHHRLGCAIVRLTPNRFHADDCCHGEVTHAGEAVDDDGAVWTPAINRGEGLAAILAYRAVHHAEELLELVVLGSGEVLDLAHGLVGGVADQRCVLRELTIPAWHLELHGMPVEVRREGQATIFVVAHESFHATLEAEQEYLYSRINQGPDDVGLPRTGRSHQHHIHPRQEALLPRRLGWLRLRH